MFKELVFQAVDEPSGQARLGGSARLPASIPWPCDAQGEPLLHLACFSAAFLNHHVPGINIGEGLLVSVFTPYSTSDDRYIAQAMQEGGQVIAYCPGASDSSAGAQTVMAAQRIAVVENPGADSEDNTIAKIAGIAAWIQDEETRDGMVYVLQINNSRLNKAAASHRGILVGGSGYLLLKPGIRQEGPKAGVWIIQAG